MRISAATVIALTLALLASVVRAQVDFDPPLDVSLAGPGVGLRIASADLDGDGILDLLVPRYEMVVSETPSLNLVLGDGAGNFPSQFQLAAGQNLYGLEVPDLNGDMVPDLVTTELFEPQSGPYGICLSIDPKVPVFLGNGSGGFVLVECLTAKDHPTDVVPGDFDSDGLVDLVVVNAIESCCGATSKQVLLFHGLGDGTFESGVWLFDRRAEDALAADFDGDGNLDLALAGGGTTYVYLGMGDGTFVLADSGKTGEARRVAAGDVNGDGADDLVALVATSNVVWVALNRNDGTGTFDPGIPYVTGASPYAVALGDLNLDGRDDVVLVNHLGNDIYVYLAQSDGSLGTPLAFPARVNPPSEPRPKSVILRDFDGDGYLDIAVGNLNRASDGSIDDGTASVLLQREPDCNGNGVPDYLDIANGTSQDCNANSVPDECDIASGMSADCNGNGIPDECDIAAGTSADCDGNGIPDECELAGNDCNGNGVLDACDIAAGTSADCDGNGIPDECELAGNDCNGNGVLDACDIAAGTSADCDSNGVPDECELAGNDCNGNGVLDACDIAAGTSLDCNANSIPDECDIASGTSADCNANGIPDECELAGNDCNGNGVLDACDIAAGTSADCNGNGIPDECDIASGTSTDCNANGIPDECELAGNDCNGNGVLDACDIAAGTSEDCNANGVPDECDIASGTSEDANGNGIPDECEPVIALCGAGGVNEGCGAPFDVIRVNDSTGGVTRTIDVAVDTPLHFVVEEAPGNVGDGNPSKTCIYIWRGAPGSGDIVTVPKGLGAMCFGPLVITTKNPVAIFNSIGVTGKLGEHNAPGPPPVIPDGGSIEFLSRPSGIGLPISVTVQGLIVDTCTQGTVPFSVTNGILIRAQ